MRDPRPMPPRPSGSVGAGRGVAVVALTLLVVACSTAESVPTPTTEPASPTSSLTATPAPTPRPTPTPAPTPRFTNEPDDELAALIPEAAAGIPVVRAPFDEFALTPGDVGVAYGEIGDRFASLVIAYVEQPRTTLYAMRLDGEPVSTEDLEPHLATAARYVGIAGLDPEPWQLDGGAGYRVWVRPEDNATAAGTMIYTWAADAYVFLLIGVDDAVNRALIESLPTEPAPTPRPTASGSASGSAVPSGSATPSSSAGG